MALPPSLSRSFSVSRIGYNFLQAYTYPGSNRTCLSKAFHNYTRVCTDVFPSPAPLGLRIRHIASNSILKDENQNYQWVAHTDGPHDQGAPFPPAISTFTDKTEDTKDLARSWVKQFIERGGVPKREFEIGYSRSSGPGGQHVNKTSTKATVRLPMNCRWVPDWAKSELRKHSTFYVVRNDSLQVSSDAHRSQSQNLAECLRKINSQIETVSSNAIPKPPDAEKMKRIAKHEAKFERAQKEAKQRSKAIKQGRGKVRPE
ncbi:hypothetical protein RSOLAG22IIIB_04959 [Rhizoctonia solani]|uniref:Prokaryotic-type class I peptide chain release factors domain-containing protein n=1 Tax=Rhizoctonia solani TaxID=456999 RepID=A0A0K6G2A1_9AGAM|nr:hypothetical protein RSOLAG22IIIB_04959 [Rhizoctonia solani]